MNDLAGIIFLLPYAGVILGRIPGLRLGRTEIVLLGTIAMIVSGAYCHLLSNILHCLETSINPAYLFIQTV